jgi:hypothetical protein
MGLKKIDGKANRKLEIKGLHCLKTRREMILGKWDQVSSKGDGS